MKKIILISLLIIILISLMSINIFAHSGDLDQYGGHFQKSDLQPMFVDNYHYHKGPNVGQIIQLLNSHIRWEDRFDYQKQMNMGSPLPTETISPSPTENVTESPTKTTIVTETPISTESANVTESKVTANVAEIKAIVTNKSNSNELPKTGENSNIVMSIIGIIVFVGGGFILVKINR